VLGLLESGLHNESESRLVRDAAKRSIVAFTLPEILLLTMSPSPEKVTEKAQPSLSHIAMCCSVLLHSDMN